MTRYIKQEVHQAPLGTWVNVTLNNNTLGPTGLSDFPISSGGSNLRFWLIKQADPNTILGPYITETVRASDGDKILVDVLTPTTVGTPLTTGINIINFQDVTVTTLGGYRQSKLTVFNPDGTPSIGAEVEIRSSDTGLIQGLSLTSKVLKGTTGTDGVVFFNLITNDILGENHYYEVHSKSADGKKIHTGEKFKIEQEVKPSLPYSTSDYGTSVSIENEIIKYKVLNGEI